MLCRQDEKEGSEKNTKLERLFFYKKKTKKMHQMFNFLPFFFIYTKQPKFSMNPFSLSNFQLCLLLKLPLSILPHYTKLMISYSPYFKTLVNWHKGPSSPKESLELFKKKKTVWKIFFYHANIKIVFYFDVFWILYLEVIENKKTTQENCSQSWKNCNNIETIVASVFPIKTVLKIK